MQAEDEMPLTEPIIDSHIHTYPTAGTGTRAQQGTGRSGDTGDIKEYLALLEDGAIEAAVMLNMTPVAEMREAMVSRGMGEEAARTEAIARMHRRNAWTCEVARLHPQLVPFISVDPAMGADEAVAELSTCLTAGARGVKLHPPNQRYEPSDKRLWPMYEEAQRLELPIIAHSGISFGRKLDAFASPHAFIPVLEQFPRLTLILAHLGEGYFKESFELAERYPNVLFDCSYAVEGSLEPPGIPDDDVAAIFWRLGVERVLFGSDWPWGHPLRDAERIRRLPLGEEEKRLILSGNARRVLGIGQDGVLNPNDSEEHDGVSTD